MGRIAQSPGNWKPWSFPTRSLAPKPSGFPSKKPPMLKRTIPLIVLGLDDKKKPFIQDTVENVYIKIPESDAHTDLILSEFGKQLNPICSAEELLLLDSKFLPVTDSLSKGTI